MKKRREGGFLIAKIHHLSGRAVARKLKEHQLDEINPGQGRIMFALWAKDNISINELAKKTSLGKSTLTSMLDRLEKSGFVKRVSSKNDRRKILICLTEKDRRLKDAYAKVSKEMVEIFYKGFSDMEIEKFENYLQRILNNVSDENC